MDLSEKAKTLWDDAQLLLEQSRYNSAVSRFYYAVFISMADYLLSIGEISDDEWMGKSQFGKSWHSFVKNKANPQVNRRLLEKLYDLRIIADYRHMHIDELSVMKNVDEALRVFEHYRALKG